MIKIIKSSRDRDIILKNNYTYEIKLYRITYVKQWCTTRTCHAKATSDLNYKINFMVFKVIPEHNHETDYDKGHKKTKIYEMKEAIRAT